MDVFAAIAQPTRRSILEMLAGNGQLSASQISHHFRVSAPAISQHLKVLREAGLVRMHKRAQQHIYDINPETVHEVEDWAGRMTALWTERLDRLETLLKEEESSTTRSRSGKDKQHDNPRSK